MAENDTDPFETPTVYLDENFKPVQNKKDAVWMDQVVVENKEVVIKTSRVEEKE